MSDSSATGRLDLLDAARSYAEKDFPVLPLQERGKRPLTRHGVKDAATNPDTVKGWWRRWPNANIGLAIPPRLLVVDLDSADAFHRLKAEDRGLPATVRTKTARGAHFWYRIPTAAKNRVGIVPGVDLRASGGYVLVPPSVHPSGAVYRWEVPLERKAIAEAPSWLLNLLSEDGQVRSRRAADWHQTISEPVSQGRRNQTLAEVAGLLFRCLPADVAAELAYCWAEVRLSPALPHREVVRTIDSIAGCELRRRRSHP